MPTHANQTKNFVSMEKDNNKKKKKPNDGSIFTNPMIVFGLAITKISQSKPKKKKCEWTLKI